MALSANTVWELRTGGSDTNGGGFVTGSGGTDYSQQNAAQLSVTDAACSGTTTVTSATGGFTAAMVGSIMYLSSGPGWYQITVYTDTNTVTVDRAGPSASGMTANVGGAFASIGQLGLIHGTANVGVSGQRAYIKSGTYTLTSTTANVSGGRYSYTGSNRYSVEGYDTTRGDDGTPPVLDVAALTTFTVITSTQTGASGVLWRNIKVDGQSGASVTGFSFAAAGVGYLLQAVDCTVGITGGNARWIKCYAEGCETGSTSSGSLYACRTKNCTTGYENPVNIARCVATGGTTGFDITFGSVAVKCIAYGCSGSGFDMNGNARGSSATDCVAVNCGAYGFDGDSTILYASLLNCAGYNNTSGNVNNSSAMFMNLNFVTLTGDPFVNAGADNFTLNNTAGAGAALRDAGVDVYGLTDYNDVGACGHQDTGGGGGGGNLLGNGTLVIGG